MPTDPTPHVKALGDTAPDFILPTSTGDHARLSLLLQTGPVVLIWYRGGWSAPCTAQLRAMQASLPRFEKLGARLLAITPETPEHAAATAKQHDLAFTIASDPGNRAADAYGLKRKLTPAEAQALQGHVDLTTQNGDASNELPLTATYLIDQDRTIRWVYLSPDDVQRADPRTVLAALEALLATPRPSPPERPTSPTGPP